MLRGWSAGGRLRTEPSEEELPRSVLEAEITQLLRTGAELRTSTPVENLQELASQFDAVLLACGQVSQELLDTWDLKTTKQHVGRGVEYLVESAVGKDRKQDALEIFRKDYQTSCLNHTQLLPSVSDTLSKLATAGLLLAVATNKPLTFSNPILEQLGIDSYFSCILGPESVPRPKPYPDMIHTALKRLGLKKHECVYIGDIPLDVETASQAAVDCILVATGANCHSDLVKAVPVPVLNTFSEIPDYLQITAHDVQSTPKSPRWSDS